LNDTNIASLMALMPLQSLEVALRRVDVVDDCFGEAIYTDMNLIPVCNLKLNMVLRRTNTGSYLCLHFVFFRTEEFELVVQIE